MGRHIADTWLDVRLLTEWPLLQWCKAILF